MAQSRSLYNPSIETLLSGKANHFASFQELTGIEYPWEADTNRFHHAQKNLYTLDKKNRGNSTTAVTTVVGSEGIYWLIGDGLDEFLGKFDEHIRVMQSEGPMPVWRLTSSEMFTDQISNMKRLLLTSIQDRVLMANLKESMGQQSDLMSREFSRSHKSVFKILEDIRQQTGNVEMMYQYDIITMERARITMEMLQRKTTSEDELGYASADLNRAIQFLDHRLRANNPRFMKIIETVQSHLKNDLRHSESNQLSRAGYWDLAFQTMSNVPTSYEGQPRVAHSELRGYRVMVLSREQEMGMSDVGRSALLTANKADRHRHKDAGPAQTKKKKVSAEGALTDEQIWEMLDKARGRSPKKEKPKHRMAFMERR